MKTALVYIAESFKNLTTLVEYFTQLKNKGFEAIVTDGLGVEAAKMADITWLRATSDDNIKARLAFGEVPPHFPNGFAYVLPDAWTPDLTGNSKPEYRWINIEYENARRAAVEQEIIQKNLPVKCVDCDQFFPVKTNFIPDRCPQCYRHSKLPAAQRFAEGPVPKTIGIAKDYYRVDPEYLHLFQDMDENPDLWQYLPEIPMNQEDNPLYAVKISGEQAPYDGFSDDDPDLSGLSHEMILDGPDEMENLVEALAERWNSR